ncbi:MAG TPA: hypothetical protein VLE51_00450 [Candidatus Saccharimonadales bacterium]|nr:hypothetical protein [Candidatus Saccharimonadales bacterium]
MKITKAEFLGLALSIIAVAVALSITAMTCKAAGSQVISDHTANTLMYPPAGAVGGVGFLLLLLGWPWFKVKRGSRIKMKSWGRSGLDLYDHHA